MSFGPPKSMSPAERSRFLQSFYSTVDKEDIAGRESRALAAVAWSHLAFAAQRRRRRSLVRVFNPTGSDHGYTSAHTVVEMVNDDMPFLVDSIGLALSRRGLALHFLAHPIFSVQRDRSGNLLGVRPREDSGGDRRWALESFQHIEIDRIVDAATMRTLTLEIERNLHDVRAACADWQAMQAAAHETADALAANHANYDANEVNETRALLAWMVHLVNTPLAIILPSMVSPFGVFLIRIFAGEALPIELLEAARVDGASEMRTFRKIALPMIMPGFVTVLLFSFIATWNNYLLPLLVFSSPRLFPLTVGLGDWNAQATSPIGSGASIATFNMVITGSLISIIPLLLLFFFLQRYWRQGLTVGAVKG